MTKDEVKDYMKTLPPLPYGMNLAFQESSFSNTFGNVYPDYPARAVVWKENLLHDRSNLEGVRQDYLFNRFDGYTIYGDVTESRLKSIHKTISRQLFKRNSDFEKILDFIQDNILFTFESVHITVRSCTFEVQQEKDKLRMYLSYYFSPGDREIMVAELNSTRSIQIGQKFLQLHKDMYFQGAKDNATLNIEEPGNLFPA